VRAKVPEEGEAKGSPDVLRSFVEQPDVHEEDRRRFRPGGGRSGIAITSRVDSSRSKILSDDEDSSGKFADQPSTRPIQDLQEQLAVLVSRLRLTTVFDQLRPKSKKSG